MVIGGDLVRGTRSGIENDGERMARRKSTRASDESAGKGGKLRDKMGGKWRDALEPLDIRSRWRRPMRRIGAIGASPMGNLSATSSHLFEPSILSASARYHRLSPVTPAIPNRTRLLKTNAVTRPRRFNRASIARGSLDDEIRRGSESIRER